MRKFFASLFAIIFILLAPLTVVATVVQVKFFTPQGVKVLLRASQIGEHLPQILSAVFSNLSEQELNQGSSPDEEFLGDEPAEDELGGDPFTQFGGQAVFEDALGKVLPAEDVYAILDQAVDTIFVWWRTDLPIQDLPLVIDLSRPKQRLAPIVLESMRQYIDSLPSCSPAQLADLENSELPDVFSLSCKPDGFSFDTFEQAGISEQALSSALLASVPDQFNVQEFLLQMEQSDSQQLTEINRRVDSLRSTVHIAFIVLRVMQVLVLLSFLMVGILRLLPAKSFFAWVGWILLLPGIELLVLSGLNTLVPTLVEQNILASTPEATEIIPIAQVVSAVTQSIVSPILWTGVGMAGVGVICIILGKVFKHLAKKSN